MKIGFKLTAIMIVLGLFAIASVSITLLIRSRTSITGVSRQYALSMTHDSAAAVGNFLESYYYKVETAAHVMEQYQYLVPSNRRTMLNVILEGIAQANPGIIGAWCVWEPDVLEGGDRQYLGTKGTSSGGRFSPYYYWENGKIEVDALEDFDEADYYLLARNSGNPTILDPFEYNVGGKMVMMTSI
ncbi:MAG: cache domain-containing protein, partial [Spirochaetaceae bacterium]|nr:cache domain-containing protein [Spirochaetaceae bacterium]